MLALQCTVPMSFSLCVCMLLHMEARGQFGCHSSGALHLYFPRLTVNPRGLSVCLPLISRLIHPSHTLGLIYLFIYLINKFCSQVL